MAIIFNYFEITCGSTPNTKKKNLWNGTILWYTPIDLKNGTHTKRKINIHKSKLKLVPKNSVLISSRAPIGYVNLSKDDCWHSQGVKGFINKNKNIVNDKYFYYWVLKNKKIFLENSSGTTFKEISKNNIENIQVTLPNILIQNKIIDIIEPLEELKNNLNNQLNLFSDFSKLVIEEYNVMEKMNKNCQFLKGEMANNFLIGETLFLNVAAANGNSNKYCDKKPNIFPGDITLSLDGNTGLVNNNLLGFNGYLYKIKSKTIPNWQIYYSLKHKINQNIIKLNETGTTIKHSSNSKQELLLLDFKQKEILKKIFYIEINLKKQINLVEKQIQKSIFILIK